MKPDSAKGPSRRAVRGVVHRIYGGPRRGELHEDETYETIEGRRRKLVSYRITREVNGAWELTGAGATPAEAAAAALAFHREELRLAKVGTVRAYALGRAVSALQELVD